MQQPPAGAPRRGRSRLDEVLVRPDLQHQFVAVPHASLGQHDLPVAITRMTPPNACFLSLIGPSIQGFPFLQPIRHRPAPDGFHLQPPDIRACIRWNHRRVGNGHRFRLPAESHLLARIAYGKYCWVNVPTQVDPLGIVSLARARPPPKVWNLEFVSEPSA